MSKEKKPKAIEDAELEDVSGGRSGTPPPPPPPPPPAPRPSGDVYIRVDPAPGESN